MTSIKHNLDRLEREAGVDATRLVGKYEIAVERLREAKAAVEDVQTIDRCREYVAAYDAVFALAGDAVKWGDAA
jgi:hypothetical protein